jgi:hypothetical protein
MNGNTRTTTCTRGIRLRCPALDRSGPSHRIAQPFARLRFMQWTGVSEVGGAGAGSRVSAVEGFV